MKHGPIALLDEDTPVVVVATNIHVYDKIVSNIQEVRARGAHVIAIATDGNEDIQHHADDVIYVPKTPAFLQAVLAIVPAAAARLPHRAAAGPERRPAAQPREDRHRRVARSRRVRRRRSCRSTIPNAIACAEGEVISGGMRRQERVEQGEGEPHEGTLPRTHSSASRRVPPTQRSSMSDAVSR